jgi:hypothetical protein
MTQPIASRPIARLAQLLLLAAVSSFAPAAYADVVVLVPPHAEVGIPEESVDRSLEALGRAIRGDGFDVVSAGQAAAVAEADDKPAELDADHCVTIECALEFVRLFDASFAVQTSLFREGKQASSVTVVVVEKADAYFSGSSEIQGGDIETAVTSAYKRARAKQSEGAGPWLSVSGNPKGASVYIDGQEFGHLPIFRRRLPAGTHRVVVRSDGYTTHNDSIDIPNRIDHEEKLDVKLTPLTANLRRRHPVDWVIGSALMAGGLLYAGSGIRDYMKDGDCQQKSGGQCVAFHDKTIISNLKLGLGGGAAVLGAAYLWWAPIGLSAMKTRETAYVNVRYSF